MKTKIKKIDISTTAPLLTMTLFAVCILIVLLLGAKLYKNSNDRDQKNFETRTAVQYLAMRVRQSDREGMYFVGNFEEGIARTEGDTFFFIEEYKGATYYTRIYCWDGYLYELFAPADQTYERWDGEMIMPMKSLQFTQKDNLLDILLEYMDERTEQLKMSLHTKGGAIYEK